MTTTQSTRPTATPTLTEVQLRTRDGQGHLTSTYITPEAARSLATELMAAAFEVDGIA